MSRHRNIRSMNIKEEYDGYDDVYGHSVEDDCCISPSDAAQFMYDREGRNREMGAYLKTQESIAEGDESEVTKLTEEEMEADALHRAKLESCMEKMQSILGDAVPKNVLMESALKHNMNPDKALDGILLNLNEPVSQIKVQTKGVRSEAPVRKIVPQTLNITKGFEVPSASDKDLLRPAVLTPRSQSPASGRETPSEGRATPDLSRTKDNKVDLSELYKKERGGQKEHLYMVVIGHVDAGKSTLMGHLLCRLGQVSQRTMHKYEMESRKIGKQSFVYAWVLDETGEERERGITMDVGRSQFETQTKKVILLDAPGHKDFIPNMIAGAGQADVALLVVDATRGEFETGFEMGGQTREHALLVRSLGVGQLAVVVNKLDTVAWSKERFEEISTKLGMFLKQAGFRDRDVTFVPCSGLTGQNLIGAPTEADLLAWYDGPSVIDVIDTFNVPDRPITKPLRFSVNDVFKATGSGLCISGRIETGSVSIGERVLVCPTREGATVRSIALEDAMLQTAFAGDQVVLNLAGIDIQNITVGCIVCTPAFPITTATKFEARVVVFNVKTPITRGYPVVLHHQSLIEPATCAKLVALLNKSTGEVTKKKPRCLGNNSSALVQIAVNRPICIELYKDYKELGRIMLRVAGVTIAAGLVTNIIE